METSNTNNGWHAIWQAKGTKRPRLDGTADELIRGLMTLAGYDSATSSLNPQVHYRQVDYIRERLAIEPTDSVYEVGCGAGAMLYSLQPHCREVGGIDFAESLVAVAREVLDASDLVTGEAVSMPRLPIYDIVLSNGVFLYFPDDVYAHQVVLSMVDKARRAIAILDVNDMANREEFEAVRRSRQQQRGRDYTNLPQLYLDQEFFHRIARDLDLLCHIDKSVMTESDNGMYRYNALLFKK